MPNLDDFTPEQLAELRTALDAREAQIDSDEYNARIKAAYEDLRSPLPSPLENPDFTGLRSLVISCIHAMNEDDYFSDNEDSHYIYEAAVEAVFGKEVWPWVREKVQ